MVKRTDSNQPIRNVIINAVVLNECTIALTSDILFDISQVYVQIFFNIRGNVPCSIFNGTEYSEEYECLCMVIIR